MKAEKALSGDFAFVTVGTFPSTDVARTLHWKKSRNFGRGKIIIAGQELGYSSLQDDGQASVAAGAKVEVYEMDVRFS